MTEFVYRRATVGDIEPLVDLRVQQQKQSHAEVHVDPNLAQIIRSYMVENLPSGKFIAFVALAGNHIVSTSGLVFIQLPPSSNNPSGLEAYIMNMYTLPDWRKRGLATKLFEMLLEYIRAEGITKVWLRATDMGKPIYRGFGFEESSTYMRRMLE